MKLNSILIEGYVINITPKSFVLVSDVVRVKCIYNCNNLEEGDDVRVAGKLIMEDNKVIIHVEHIERRGTRTEILYQEELEV